jgi:hypothetical protein
MKLINFETNNMKVITNKYLLISLLVLTTLFYSSVSFAAANLEDTMAWVSKKVSNDFCTKLEETKVSGRVWYRTIDDIEPKKIQVTNKVYSEERFTSGELSKHQGKVQIINESKSWQYLRHGNEKGYEEIKTKTINSGLKYILSLESILKIRIEAPKTTANYHGNEYETNTAYCWRVYIETEEDRVKYNYYSGKNGFISQAVIYFNDKSMAQRVKKALEHAVKLAKSEELF